MAKHYIAMAGLHGYMPQYCEVYHTVNDAAEGLALVHELGKNRTRKLKRGLYLELNLHRDGNEYCEIVGCDCDDPQDHSEDTLDPGEW